MNDLCNKHNIADIHRGKFGRYCKACQTEHWKATDEERVFSKVVRK